MDAVEFLKELGRLCSNYLCVDNCPLIGSCDDDNDDGYVRKVQIVEQWAKEHPVKTRQSEILKLFPNAKIDNAGTLCICPINFDPETYKGENKCFCIHKCDDIQCDECRRDFWLKEIE